MLRHKVFLMRWAWSLNAARLCEEVRREAEDFASKIGVHNVVSITELNVGRYSVTVWYREDITKDPLDF
jgi:hypothetical protein